MDAWMPGLTFAPHPNPTPTGIFMTNDSFKANGQGLRKEAGQGRGWEGGFHGCLVARLLRSQPGLTSQVRGPRKKKTGKVG